MFARGALLGGVMLAGIGLASQFSRADEPAANPADARPAAAPAECKPPATTDIWSPAVNQLRGRIEMHRAEVFNGTVILSTTLHLENLSDLASPLEIPLDGARFHFQVLDADGLEIPKDRHGSMPYSGISTIPDRLLLPYTGKLSFEITQHGMGVPADRLAAFDLNGGWVLTKEDRACTIRGSLEVPEKKVEHPQHVWHGRLEFPAVALPLTAEPLDPATAEETIRKLGSAMLDPKGHGTTKAQAALSLIDDPRVIPWYLKLLAIKRYDAKFTALDRLASFNSDDALAGIEQGLATKPSDVRDSTPAELAAESAEQVRHSAAGALSRSRHPRAKTVLLSLYDDRSMPVRLTVLHELGRMKDEASLETIRKMIQSDPDQTIRREAQRYLDLRTKVDQPAQEKK